MQMTPQTDVWRPYVCASLRFTVFVLEHAVKLREAHILKKDLIGLLLLLFLFFAKFILRLVRQ